jgi:hypothetical protein
MEACFARIVMVQKKFMKKIGICRELDNIILIENTGGSVESMLITGQKNQGEHSGLVLVQSVVALHLGILI